MMAAFQARGMSPEAAKHTAEASLAGLVARQATVLMFEKLFLLSGLAFLAVLPLLYFLRSPDHDEPEKVGAGGAPKPDVHIEL